MDQFLLAYSAVPANQHSHLVSLHCLRLVSRLVYCISALLLMRGVRNWPSERTRFRNLRRFPEISRFQLGFRDFTRDFLRFPDFTRYFLRFRDFTRDFGISVHARSRASGIRSREPRKNAITEKYRGPVQFIVQLSITEHWQRARRSAGSLGSRYY